MTADLDTRFQTAIADDLPSFLVNPTGDLEESEAIASDLTRSARTEAAGPSEAGAAELDDGDAAAPPRLRARLHRHPVVVQHRRTARR